MSNGVPHQGASLRRNSASDGDIPTPVAAPFVLNEEALNNLSKFLSYYGRRKDTKRRGR